MKIVSAHVTPGRAGSHRMAVVVVAVLPDNEPVAYAIDPDSGTTLLARPVRNVAEVGISLIEVQDGGFPPIIDEPLPPPPRQPHGTPDRVVAVARQLWRSYQDATREAVGAVPS
ncbi:MAG TPA: hypothetical protein VHE35_37055 [Kofleriaceae bacterium]|nr:hypothetical protein [Kofleriaceae bacterium]